MQFTLALVALASAAFAAPQVGGGFAVPGLPTVPSDTTIGQAGDACGTDTELTCCNKMSTSGDSVNAASGILSGFLSNALGGQEGLGLGSGCSKMNLPLTGLGAGVTDLLNSQCKQTAACCQHSGSQQNGFINAGIPCVALGGLL